MSSLVETFSIALTALFSSHPKIKIAGNASADCAFRIEGGFGDHITGARYIRDLIKETGEFTFDIYSPHPDFAVWIFKCFPGFQSAYSEHFAWPLTKRGYKVKIGVTDFVENRGIENVSGNQPDHIRRLLRVVEKMDKARREIRNLDQFISHHPFMDNFHAKTAATMGYRRHNFMHALSDIKYSEAKLSLDTEADVKPKFGLPQIYITIADGYEYSFHTSRAAKVYSTKSYPYYEKLIALIKQRFPNIFIIQVGKDVGKPMIGADLVLLNKTSLRELAAVLKNSRLHIDNEGGIVHLATSLGVKCCVIFGPTPLEYFGYDENINIAPPVCGNCYWITEDWMSNCPRGYGEARCLTQQRPETILNRIAPELKKIAYIDDTG